MGSIIFWFGITVFVVRSCFQSHCCSHYQAISCLQSLMDRKTGRQEERTNSIQKGYRGPKRTCDLLWTTNATSHGLNSFFCIFCMCAVMQPDSTKFILSNILCWILLTLYVDVLMLHVISAGNSLLKYFLIHANVLINWMKNVNRDVIPTTANICLIIYGQYFESSWQILQWFILNHHVVGIHNYKN